METDRPLEDVIDSVYNSILCNNHTKDIEEEMANIAYISDRYEYVMGEENRKKTGRFYTDKSIIKYMLEDVLNDIDVSQNPYIRILDPSCGCGYFLTQAYDILKERFIIDLDKVNMNNPGLNLKIEDIHNHIIENNIYGADLDEYGIKLSITGLMLKNPASEKIPNIICCDSILNWEDFDCPEREFWCRGYDIIIGNPPYIGHKQTDGGYRKKLNSLYGDIFKDKSDISFCFIKSSIDRLVRGGRLCFITSRYFIESPSGRAIRGYINQNCIIEKIVDFYGVRIMKGISVDPVISFFRKEQPANCNKIKVIKAEGKLKSLEGDSIFYELKSRGGSYFSFFELSQSRLKDEGWALCRSDELSIVDKIEQSLHLRLSDICMSFQGIITGCDGAFIVDETTIERLGIERSIIRRWIKGSSIDRFKTNGTNSYIIYSDYIENPNDFNNALSYIEKYRERLENRRECKKGVREWYKLQWGRDSRLFEMKKIIFPYKSSCNRFALDEGSYGSADIYGMYIKDGFKDKVSYEFLLGILNSKLYEFYFKSFAKKLGDNLYDYYPNTVMRLMIPGDEDFNISKKVKTVLENHDDKVRRNLIDDIDKDVYKMFDISAEEIMVIEGRLMKL